MKQHKCSKRKQHHQGAEISFMYVDKNGKTETSGFRNLMIVLKHVESWRVGKKMYGWVNFSASPVASTNQFSIEDVLQAVKLKQK